MRPLIAGMMLIFSFMLAAEARARVVTDQTGRVVEIPESARRVVALAPSIAEIVFALGRADRLVGVTAFSDFPAEAQKLPQVGSHVHLDLEKIVSLNPDLCIGVKEANSPTAVARLQALNIAVYIVNPENFATVMQSISDIGGLLNCPETAAALVADMSARIDKVKARVAKATERPGVFFQIGLSPIVSVGDRSFVHELIELAGGRNLAAGPVPFPRFSKEQVLRMRPEIIIISSMARDGKFEDAKAQWRLWDQLPAVRNNRIHIIDSDIVNRGTVRLIAGLEALADLIHPEMAEAAK
jgi:iron complex transport system substrate-binding protein